MVLLVSTALFAAGTTCLVMSFVSTPFFWCGSDCQPAWAAAVIGLVAPWLLLCACICWRRPSLKQQRRRSFYGDALLEQLLSGACAPAAASFARRRQRTRLRAMADETIHQHYTVQGRRHRKNGVIVFVSGVAQQPWRALHGRRQPRARRQQPARGVLCAHRRAKPPLLHHCRGPAGARHARCSDLHAPPLRAGAAAGAGHRARQQESRAGQGAARRPAPALHALTRRAATQPPRRAVLVGFGSGGWVAAAPARCPRPCLCLTRLRGAGMPPCTLQRATPPRCVAWCWPAH